MITRPLDLLSKLRPPPRNFDFLFLVNGGLIALFFTLFSSHFVLSPGLRVNGADLTLSESPGALNNPVATPVSISINANGQVWGDTGLIPDSKLNEWFSNQIKRAPGSTLLVIADRSATTGVTMKIKDAAVAAGFKDIQLAEQMDATATGSAP